MTTTKPTQVVKTLTGRIRHRKSAFFEHLVLEVEETTLEHFGEDVTRYGREYRDAKFEDVGKLMQMGKNPVIDTQKNLDKDDEWLTGEVMYRPALFSDRMVLYVETYESILTNSSAGYQRAKPINLERGVRLEPMRRVGT